MGMKNIDRHIEVGKARFEPVESIPCDLCNRLAGELAPLHWVQADGSKGVDDACEWCRAVLEVTQGLMDNGVEDENEIITTIALAAYAGQSWIEIANRPSELFSQQYPGLAFSRNVDGMPLYRMLPVSTEIVRYDGTDLPREIRITVSSRTVQAHTLAAIYEQVLVAEGIPSNQCPAGSVAWSTEDLTLTIMVKPGDEIPSGRTRYLAAYPQGPIYHFPPAEVIREIYRTLLGSIDKRALRGYAYSLGDHDRPLQNHKSAKGNILACLAWWFGEYDNTTPPLARRPRVSHVLNRHLLSPYDMSELPQGSWSSSDAVWRDAREVAPRFNRASFLWQRSED